MYHHRNGHGGVAVLAALARVLTMPTLINNPAHWQLRADETRVLADHLIDPVARATILKIAEEYDRLALRALQRMQEERVPN
jgi:hypothetical protein